MAFMFIMHSSISMHYVEYSQANNNKQSTLPNKFLNHTISSYKHLISQYKSNTVSQIKLAYYYAQIGSFA